ncbi:hypothetical protein LEMLEM_LOCUS20735 [Lemmus lemmus]
MPPSSPAPPCWEGSHSPPSRWSSPWASLRMSAFLTQTRSGWWWLIAMPPRTLLPRRRYRTYTPLPALTATATTSH